MNNTSSIIRIASVFLCIIIIFSYGIYTFFFKSQTEPQSTVNYLNTFLPFSFEQKTVTKAGGATALQITDSDSTVVQTGTTGEVSGKIINKTVEPDSLNVSGGGVHIKNSTDLDVDIGGLLSSGLKFNIKKDGSPQVLILHTHATECFLNENRDYYTAADNSRTTDNSQNVTELGAIMEKTLNAAGIVTIHDRTQHDYPSYNGSYSRAAATIKGYLNKYPSIKVVIDVHRDAIQSGSTKTKLTTEIDGKSAAQVMLVMGSQSGNVKNFENWQENLKLALRFQKNMENMYPTLARPLSLMPRSYNEPLTTGSMLLEIGTDANSFSEAYYAAGLAAEALVKTLTEEQ